MRACVVSVARPRTHAPPTHRIVVAQPQRGLIRLVRLITPEGHLMRDGLEDRLTHRHNAGHL